MLVTLQIPSKRFRNRLKIFIKIAVTVVCIIYISHKIDLSKMPAITGRTNFIWLMMAVLAFILSKLMASYRLSIYFSNISIHLSSWQNIKLYWLGMFYNLFLPGSIGGDAYKVLRLSKTFNIPHKKTAAAVLLDRFSGLVALGILFCFSGLFVFQSNIIIATLLAGIVLIIPLYYFLVKFFFKTFLPGFWRTFLWGIAVQLFQVLAMYCILNSLHIHQHLLTYIVIFLASSVMAVLPFTIGGLGARELIFIWGAQYFLLDNTVSVMASALFYIITVISSVLGMPFIFLDPLQKKSAATHEEENIR